MDGKVSMLEFGSIFKIASQHKFRAVMIMVISVALALVVHQSKSIQYGAYIDVYMVQNSSCRSDLMPKWINSRELLAPFDDYEVSDETYEEAIKTSLIGKKFSVWPEPYGVRIDFWGSDQEYAFRTIETLKYHLLLYSKIQNEIMEDIYKEYSMPLENKMMNGMYIKVGEPHELKPTSRGSIIPVIVTGICIAVFIILLCAYITYRRERMEEQ